MAARGRPTTVHGGLGPRGQERVRPDVGVHRGRPRPWSRTRARVLIAPPGPRRPGRALIERCQIRHLICAAAETGAWTMKRSRALGARGPGPEGDIAQILYTSVGSQRRRPHLCLTQAAMIASIASPPVMWAPQHPRATSPPGSWTGLGGEYRRDPQAPDPARPRRHREHRHPPPRYPTLLQVFSPSEIDRHDLGASASSVMRRQRRLPVRRAIERFGPILHTASGPRPMASTPT